MTRRHGHDQCVECGQPANRQLVCPTHEALYADRLVDDVDPASRPPLPLRIVQEEPAQ